MRDHTARATAALALAGVFLLSTRGDHGGWYAFEIVMAVFWTVTGISEMIMAERRK